jgi:TRAP-type mannitol/chloroaromatic compound transport system permease small subunit
MRHCALAGQVRPASPLRVSAAAGRAGVVLGHDVSQHFAKRSQTRRLSYGRITLQGLLALATGIDRLNRFFGIVAALLVAVSCLISALNALSRYAFDFSSNAYLEIQWQMFAGIFLLGAPYVLKLNEHVRVDLFYGALSARSKLWVDVFGFLVFLFPVCVLMLDMSIPWALSSWREGEMSANAGGLPVWPVKLLLPLGFVLLSLQGVAELIRRLAALRGIVAFDPSYEKPVQ